MIPESKLIKSEITLRDLSLPDDIKLARKSLIRWLALSLGLISPNESHMLLLDILEVLISFHVKNEQPTTVQILEALEKLRSGEKKCHPKAVYYHLLRLKESGFISRKKGQYYIGDGDSGKLSQIFRRIYSQKSDSVFKKIDEAFSSVESGY